MLVAHPPDTRRRDAHPRGTILRPTEIIIAAPESKPPLRRLTPRHRLLENKKTNRLAKVSDYAKIV
jgi:hypothetical protein